MKNTRTLLLLVVLSLTSLQCQDKSLVPFTMNVKVFEDLKLNNHSGLDEALKELFTCREDSFSIYIPELVLERLDTPLKEGVNIPLSALNEWRKGMNLLSPLNAKEDYQENLERFKAPEILTMRTGLSADSGLLTGEEHAFIIEIDNDPVAQIRKMEERVLEKIDQGQEIVVILKRKEKSPLKEVKPTIKKRDKPKPEERPRVNKTPVLFVIHCASVGPRTSFEWDDLDAGNYRVTFVDNDTNEEVYQITTGDASINVVNISMLQPLRTYHMTVSARRGRKTIRTATKTFSLTDDKTMINPTCCKNEN